MEVLAHVNKRVKSRPQIQLPVEQLIQQYEAPDCSPFVANFDIVYLKMGYHRLSQDKQVELAPRLIGCIDKKPLQQQDSILQLTCPVLGHITQVSSDKLQSLFKFDERPGVKQAILSFCLDFLLVPYKYLGSVILQCCTVSCYVLQPFTCTLKASVCSKCR
jgi:proteasome component ECM29